MPDGEPGADRGRPHRRGEPDRQRAGRRGRGRHGRPGHQEEPAGARRLRPVRRPGRRRPRPRGRRRGDEPVHQLRAELPGRQALRRARGRGRASSAGGSPPRWRTCASATRATRRPTIGPMARLDLRDALERQVRESVRPAPPCSPAARRLEGPGAFFAPTVLAGVTLDMPVMAEETFGPVAAVVAVADDDEAVRVANATRYGLGASVWSHGPGARPRRRPADHLGRPVRQRRRRLRPAAAVRGHEAQRLRPGARRGRSAGVHQRPHLRRRRWRARRTGNRVSWSRPPRRTACGGVTPAADSGAAPRSAGGPPPAGGW